MKKLFVTALAAVLVMGVANAQMPSKEEVQASVERYQKLKGLTKPAAVGVSEIDNYADKAQAAANNTVEVSTLLERIAGVSSERNAETPLTLEEYTALSKKVEQENKDMKELAEMAAPAAAALKGVKPLAMPKANKSLGYSKEVVSIATAEAAYHTKTLAGILETIKK